MATAPSDLADLLFGRTRQRVLGFLYAHPTERFHLRQVGRLTRTGPGPLQRELAQLARAGLVTREKEGIQTLYRANAASPVFAEIRGLLLKTVGAAGAIQSALQPLAARIGKAWLFGSISRGEERAESDIDLLVVSDSVTMLELVRALKPVEAKLSREVNPVLYIQKDFDRRLREKDPFLARVLESKPVALIGDGHESG